MRTGTKIVLEVTAIAALPVIGGMLLLGSWLRQVGEAIDSAQQYLEEAVRTELEHWTQG